MKYEMLLFDVDNTLLDFDANEAESFKNMIEDKGQVYSEELYIRYKEMNHEMWKAVERGEMTIDEVVNTRFAKLMDIYGRKVDGEDYEKTYRSYLNKGIQEKPHVHEVLSELKKKYKLYVITNGIKTTQNFRMKGSGLENYFEKCFISETVGANKPSMDFFDHVKENIECFDASKALVIGDSLTSDIKGGNDAGIDTCWICRKGTVNHTDIIPKYTINSLEELFEILG
ncbi:YjjG family noncanonical pyrimidine nucleotidase [uncultured Clostridium sp.]|uniref:YjjG family noncanonical pyrimidine nucleotidase n=1 Tax=uncultured Clostridium sp. TaxID=59620 RepID=UPI0025F42A2E|nr:YjjG family noncanonical pyrimidine nucleotidase [uncultured Clostridium sp.]